MPKRVVLAYSGGLDTSVAISWIGHETGADVVAVSIDLGQGGEDMDTVRQRALGCGAVEAVVVDARDEFADDFVCRLLKLTLCIRTSTPWFPRFLVPSL